MSVSTFCNRHFISFRFQFYFKNFSLIKKLYLCFYINQIAKMQKLITPEKSPMIYCDRFDYTLSDNLDLGGGRDVRDYIPEEELLKICRPVFTLLKLVKSESYMIDYLYWFKPTDLDEIDEKVRTDFMLAMAEEGYDTCPLGGYDSHRIKKLLHLPYGAEVSMVVTCGIREERGIWGERFRLPFEEVYRNN